MANKFHYPFTTSTNQHQHCNSLNYTVKFEFTKQKQKGHPPFHFSEWFGFYGVFLMTNICILIQYHPDQIITQICILIQYHPDQISTQSSWWRIYVSWYNITQIRLSLRWSVPPPGLTNGGATGGSLSPSNTPCGTGSLEQRTAIRKGQCLQRYVNSLPPDLIWNMIERPVVIMYLGPQFPYLVSYSQHMGMMQAHNTGGHR